jgi:hypothetical protein
VFRGETIQFSLRRFLLTGSLFVCSATVAGGLTGAILGRLMAVVAGGTVLVFVSVGVVALLLLADLAGRPLLLQRNTETPRQWVDQPPWRWAILNGAALGSGALTRIAFPIWYVLPLIGIATRSSVITAVCWGAYGLVRASASLVVGGQRIRAGRPPDVARDLLVRPSTRFASDVIALGAVAVILAGGVT